METEKIFERLKTKGAVYIYNDYEECCVRLHRTSKQTDAYIKHKGRKEFKSKTSNKLVFDTELEGVEITKEEYDRY